MSKLSKCRMKLGNEQCVLATGHDGEHRFSTSCGDVLRGTISCVRPPNHEGDHRSQRGKVWTVAVVPAAAIKRGQKISRCRQPVDPEPGSADCCLPAGHLGNHETPNGFRWCTPSDAECAFPDCERRLGGCCNDEDMVNPSPCGAWSPDDVHGPCIMTIGHDLSIYAHHDRTDFTWGKTEGGPPAPTPPKPPMKHHNRCEDIGPDGKTQCYAPRGHDGSHRSYGGTLLWAAPPMLLNHDREKCKERSLFGLGDAVCAQTKGHSGEHISKRGAVWVNHKDDPPSPPPKPVVTVMPTIVLCGMESRHGYVCKLEKGHDGIHKDGLTSWPDHLSAGEGRCGGRSPFGLGAAFGAVCDRPAGHDGNHNSKCGAVWANHKDNPPPPPEPTPPDDVVCGDNNSADFGPCILQKEHDSPHMGFKGIAWGLPLAQTCESVSPVHGTRCTKAKEHKDRHADGFVSWPKVTPPCGSSCMLPRGHAGDHWPGDDRHRPLSKPLVAPLPPRCPSKLGELQCSKEFGHSEKHESGGSWWVNLDAPESWADPALSKRPAPPPPPPKGPCPSSSLSGHRCKFEFEHSTEHHRSIEDEGVTWWNHRHGSAEEWAKSNPQTKFLYLLTPAKPIKNKHRGDFYQSCVVVAESEEAARQIHPGDQTEGWKLPKDDSTWPKPEGVKVELLGTSIPLQDNYVVCADWFDGSS